MVEEYEEVKPTGAVDESLEDTNDYVLEPSDEVKDTPAESSDADEPDAESESEPDETEEVESEEETEESVDDSVEEESEIPKPVEGETPVERARRLQIEKLRKQKNEWKQKALSVNKKEENLIIKDNDKLSKYKPEEVQELIDIVKSQGFVQKDELVGSKYEETKAELLEEFFDKHPEYKAENDEDDLLWKQFVDRWESGIYNQRPPNPKQLKTVFENIHKDIFGSQKIESKSIAAKKEKIKSVSHPSGNSNTPSKDTKSVDPSLRAFFPDATDEDLKEWLN